MIWRMKALTAYTKKRFLREHLRHRLTLLRTLGSRVAAGHDFAGQGDLYRCVKDSNLIAVRLLMDFLGLRAEYHKGRYRLAESKRKFPSDVKLDQFFGRLLKPSDVPRAARRVLAGVYARGDKELAHLTLKFNKPFNEEKALIDAATAVASLIQKFVYDDKPLPPIDA